MANSRVHLPHPTSYTKGLEPQFATWLQRLHRRLGEGPFMVRGYSVTGLPTASEWGNTTDFSSLIYVYDATGGATIAFSNGTNWLRLSDNTVVS